MNREKNGRFAKVRGFFRRLIRLIVRLVVITLIVGALTAGVGLGVYYHITHATEAPKQEDTFDAWFDRKVTEYKQREDFKVEVGKYADQLARTRIMQATITRMEQKTK